MPVSANKKESPAAPPPIVKKKSVPLWVWGAGGGVFAAIVIGAVVFALSGKTEPPDKVKVTHNVPKAAPEPQVTAKAETTQEGPWPKETVALPLNKPDEAVGQAAPPAPVVAELPADKAPSAIEPASTNKVKKATVYLHVVNSQGQTAEGSGFFALEPGIVLTNAHVVGMLEANSKPPKKIEVVLHSGQADEVTLAGQVIGVDRDNDLAMLRVQENKNRWPAPLAVEFDMSRLTELQKVYILGFPLGAGLGKEITASESSISSFRRDALGQLFQIQVNGGMQPGNSGGPVVDTRGVVVGVAVAIIRGTQLSFVVPGEKVLGIVNGRVQEMRPGHLFRDQEQTKLPVKIAYLDPLQRIRGMHLEVWTGPPGKSRPPSLQAPAPLPGDGQSQVFPVTLKDGAASPDIVLPTPSLKPNQVYWLRPVLVNQANAKQWGMAVSYKPSAAPPLSRVPAKLVANMATGDRSLLLSSKNTIQLSKGPGKIVEIDDMKMEVLEHLDASPTGADIKLRWGKGEFFEEFAGKRMPRMPAAYRTINDHVHGFKCDRAGALSNFGFVKFNFKDAILKEEANDMAAFFLTSYQFISLPLPNRDVQALQTWDSKMRLMLGREKKKEVLDVVLACTYEGSREVSGKNEALVSLMGQIKVLQTELPLIRKPTDRVSGYAVVDVAGGFVSELHISLNDERELGGVFFTRTFEANVSRVPGNIYSIIMPSPKGNPPDLAKKAVNPKKEDSKASGLLTGAKEYSPKNNRFTILLPAGDKGGESTRVINSGKFRIPVEVGYSSLKNGTTYTAASVGTPAQLLKGVSPNKRMDFFRDLIIQSMNGRVKSDRDLEQAGLRGKEYRIETPTSTCRMQIYLLGGFGFYALLEAREGDDVTSPSADAFFASFKMTPERAETNRPQPNDPKTDGAPNSRIPYAGKDGATRIMGGGGDPEFKDDAPAGGRLIGFDVFVLNNVIRGVRPIYTSGDGKESKGNSYGNLPPGAMTVKAKPGYAVGGLIVNAGLGLDAFTVAFMRMKGDGLDPDDAYQSDPIGGKGGNRGALGGNGKPVIGIVGKANNRGECTGIGLVMTADTSAPKAPIRGLGGKDGATRIFGGGGDPEFKDEAPPGGRLIGLEVALDKFGRNDVIRAVRPIYRSPEGETKGSQYGNRLGRPIVTVKAKDGYAMGALALNAGGGLDGFTIIFMRMAGDKLDPTDSYESEYV
ncbi:MAG TPA: serine protease, partial [Gemmataceae bacterium]|nr:serine protease [Gemmataceae bacterium]